MSLRDFWKKNCTPPRTDCWKEGDAAYRCGSNIDSNPYTKGSMLYDNWNKGFKGK